MATDNSDPQSSMKRGHVLVQPGQPLQFMEEVGADTTNAPANSAAGTIGATLRAYQRAAQKLLETKYIGQRELTPPNMKGLCNIFVARANLERILGPLSFKGQNVELDYFKEAPKPAK